MGGFSTFLSVLTVFKKEFCYFKNGGFFIGIQEVVVVVVFGSTG